MNASQNRPGNNRTAANKVARTLALSLLLAACIVSGAVAQTKICECEFSNNEYEAYGTGGACGIFMYNKDKTCEVSFAGAGANTEIIRKELGKSALQNQFKIVPDIFKQYLTYIEKGEKGLFLDPAFIEISMVVIARAALFRKSSVNANLPLKKIDALFGEFSKNNSKQIAATFQGKAKPFQVEPGKVKNEPVKGVVFSVGKGYVELNFQQEAKVLVLYFSEHRR